MRGRATDRGFQSLDKYVGQLQMATIASIQVEQRSLMQQHISLITHGLLMPRSDSFEEYVGQLQMATIASIQVEQGGTPEMSHREITDKLRPLQQVRATDYTCTCMSSVAMCSPFLGRAGHAVCLS